MMFMETYGLYVYVNIFVAIVTAVFFAVVILQIVYVQSKLSKNSFMLPLAQPNRIPFGLFAVYVDDVKTTQLNKNSVRVQVVLPSVSVTYYSSDESSNSFPITTSYVPTNFYMLALKNTDSAESLKLMIKNNDANYVVISRSLYCVTIHNDTIVLYTPMQVSSKDFLEIVSFTGACTNGSFDRLKTLSPAAPVHVLAYKV